MKRSTERVVVFLILLLAAACEATRSRDAAAVGDEARDVKVAGAPAASEMVAFADALRKKDAPAGRSYGLANRVDGAGAAGGKTEHAAVGGVSLMGAPRDTNPSMLIRNGNASVEVDSLDRGIAMVRLLAARVGGSIANTTTQTGKNQLHMATLEIRIPSFRFDEAVGGLTPIGHVEGVTITAEDVGEEYVDITARVKNAHRLEERLIELLANRTGKLADVLTVEHELARVREEIERYEGRLRYLRTRVATSTLSVNVHEKVPVIAVAAHNPIVEASREAWRNFVQFIARMVASLGFVVPLVLIGYAAFVIIRRAVVRYAPRLRPSAS